MRIGSLLVALVLPVIGAAPAWGAVSDAITIEAPTQKFNIANCKKESFSFNVTFTNNSEVIFSTSGAPYEVWIGRGTSCTADSDDPANIVAVSCKDAADNCCQRLKQDTITVDATSGSATVALGAFDMVDYLPCDSAKQGEFELIVYTQPGYSYVAGLSQVSTDWKKQTLNVAYDFQRPTPPTLGDVVPGETHIVVNWTPISGDNISYRAYASVSTIAQDKSIDDQRGSLVDLQNSPVTDTGADNATIDGLRALTEYQVVVVSIDAEENESLPSESKTVQTIKATDFYQAYREMGGSEAGGYCALAPAGGGGRAGAGGLLASLLATFALVAWRRRARRAGPRPGRARGGAAARRWAAWPVAALLGLALGLLAPQQARAESPRILTFAFSMGNYRPLIDSEFSSSAGTGPYKRYFGEDSAFVYRLDLGWNLFTAYGTLSAGFGVSYGTVSAKSFVQGTDQRSVETTELKLLPLSLSLSYALDLFADRYSFPLVPFGSVGLDYALYWIYNGAGSVASTTTPAGEGKGGVPGYHVSVVARLLLDVFAPEMATSFDHDMGVNNSYLFVEYLKTYINHYNARNSMNLSADSLFFGIAFDF